jgi:hypothetical protein
MDLDDISQGTPIVARSVSLAVPLRLVGRLSAWVGWE